MSVSCGFFIFYSVGSSFVAALAASLSKSSILRRPLPPGITWRPCEEMHSPFSKQASNRQPKPSSMPFSTSGGKL